MTYQNLNLEGIMTEANNKRTQHIDVCSTLEMVTLMNEEDKQVAHAVERELTHIASAIDAIVGQARVDD